MNLDDKEVYLGERIKLYRLQTKELERLLEELYDRRYNHYDISIGEYYRLVSHVYNRRVRTGGSLVYHLKNFLG